MHSKEKTIKITKIGFMKPFGLEHCQNNCVMKFSNSLTETDRKPPKYCNSCRHQVSDLISSLS